MKELLFEVLQLDEEEKKALSPETVKTLLSNLDKAMEGILDERSICVLRKRYAEGMTFRAAGQKIVKLSQYKETPCEGVTGVRAQQIIQKAIRKLRHPVRRRIILGESG